MNKSIGIIASSGGSVIFELYPYLRRKNIKLIIATDRDCGIERLCEENKVIYKRFSYVDKATFSKSVGQFFYENNVEDLVLLFYTRFIDCQIYDKFLTLNFHPSLLPLFPGLNPLQRQLERKVPLLGATTHKVDKTCDGGEIVGQIINSYTNETASKISFMQVCFLTLSAFEMYLDNKFKGEHLGSVKHYINTSMSLTKDGDFFFRSLERKIKIKVLS